AAGFGAHRVAERLVPRLRRSHDDAGISARPRPAARNRGGPPDRHHVRRERAVALPQAAHCRRADRAGRGRGPHPGPEARRLASAFAARPDPRGPQSAVPRRPIRSAFPRGRLTRVIFRATAPPEVAINRLVGPSWAVLLGGLVAVVALGYLEFASGPELTPLLFYLVPTVFVAWSAGQAPGFAVAGACAVAWLLSDALTHRDYAHWSIPYWNGVLRLGALGLVAETAARLRAAQRREREVARADAVTGVANLRVFYEIADAEIVRARRYPHVFSVAYIDLDEFKLVNFRMGHAAGDAVLRAVARALSGVLRASDAVARVGGDRFVVLLPEAGRGLLACRPGGLLRARSGDDRDRARRRHHRHRRCLRPGGAGAQEHRARAGAGRRVARRRGSHPHVCHEHRRLGTGGPGPRRSVPRYPPREHS